jgi:MoxR-like ATPase
VTDTEAAHRMAAPSDQSDWRIYRGTGQPHDEILRLPPPPRWRVFEGAPLIESPPARTIAPVHRPGVDDRARAYLASDEVVEMVNAAIYLRRPLLVTGKPGTGKSTLAYSIAYELRLGPVLYWPITSRSTLRDGLYGYDAIGRLQETNLQSLGPGPATVPDIGRYLHLAALGTALLPQTRPRVLLIDELDKSDIDLPNDLLNVFEEGHFGIPELARLPEEQATVFVLTADGGDRVPVVGGRVGCRAFPIVVITSNGEREFPPAFLRRCLRLDIRPPGEADLTKIVSALLGPEAAAESTELVRDFVELRERGDLATDQLLNAVYLVTSGLRPPDSARERLLAALLRQLDTARPG